MIKRIGSDPELVQQAFDETEKQREAQRTRLEQEQRQLFGERQHGEDEIKRLVAAIDSSNTPLTTIAERLREAEDFVDRIRQRLAEIEEETDRIKSEAVDKEHLVDALTRFGSLWETLVERERTQLIHRLLESVVYDQTNGEISVVFRPRAPEASPARP